MSSHPDPRPPVPPPDAPGDAKPLELLEREICELAAHIAAATCRWLLLVAEWDTRGGWAEWGVNSCAHWLSWRCSIGLSTAREHVRVARRLVGLPLVREAFATGELSYSKVRAVTRVAEPATEAQLVALARHATGAQLENVVRGYRGALAATNGAAQTAYELRYLRWYWDDQGSLRLDARIPAAEGALLLKALELELAVAAEPDRPGSKPPEFEPGPHTDGGDTATDAPYDDDSPFIASPIDEFPRESVAARRADALVAIARQTLLTATTTPGEPDQTQVVVHVDVETLAGDRVHERSEIEHGPVIAPETMRRLACDASVVRIIEDDGRPLSVGRRRRTIPPALRRALRSRDGGCRFPGCEHSRFLHAHHIQHWARGGRTDLENLVHVCTHHHQLLHEGGYSVEVTGAGAFRFRRPDGRIIPDVCQGARAHGADVAAQNRRHGVAIDGRTCMGKSAGDPIDYGIAVEGLIWRHERGERDP